MMLRDRSARLTQAKKPIGGMLSSKTGSDLFIVDNSDEEWKVLNYLSE
jgi:hypothetical protein